MTGIIWLVQLVHYPMFLGLDRGSFTHWHEFHSHRISFIVAPLMVFELGASIFSLVKIGASGVSVSLFLLTLCIWAATFFISVPCHTRLEDSFDETVARRLTTTNWIRTILYSAKLTLMICALLLNMA
jgi:hypothetical protein